MSNPPKKKECKNTKRKHIENIKPTYIFIHVNRKTRQKKILSQVRHKIWHIRADDDFCLIYYADPIYISQCTKIVRIYEPIDFPEKKGKKKLHNLLGWCHYFWVIEHYSCLRVIGQPSKLGEKIGTIIFVKGFQIFPKIAEIIGQKSNRVLSQTLLKRKQTHQN